MTLPAPTRLDPARQGDLARRLLDGLEDGVSLLDAEGIILHANRAEERMFGFAPGGLVGVPLGALTDLPAKAGHARVAAMLVELRRTGRWEGEWPSRRRDGSGFRSRMRIRRADAADEACWLCIREDAAQDGAEARSLAEERARLALATQAAGIGIWDIDPISGEFACSQRFKTIFGLPPDRDVTRAAVEELIHPDDLALVHALSERGLDPAIRSRESYEYRVVRPDGVVRWVLANGEAIFEENGPQGPRAVRYLGALQDITDRRLLEEAERRTAQRLRLALEAGRMAVWETDVARDVIAGSSELNRLLGFPEDAPIDIREVRARYAPGEHERVAALGLAAMERGETSFEAEFRYQRAPGDLRWLRLRCDVLFDEDRRPVRAIGVLFDETGRRRAEEELRASEDRLHLATAAAAAGIWEWDLVGQRMIWSPEEFALLGIDQGTPPEALEAAWQGVLHPDDLAEVEARTERTRLEGGGFVMDFRILRDGETRWLRSHVTAVAGPDGRPARLVGIEMDVTAEHREAEALHARADALADEVLERRREQERFHALSSDLFAVAGFDGYLKSINPAWSRLLGYNEAELLARPFVEFIHPDDHAAAAEAVGRMAGGSALLRFQDRLVAKDGRVLWIDWAGVPEGQRFHAVGRDVTREREQEDVLRQSQKMDALGQLTGGIAHDFNNLLQAVQGSLALIERRPDDPERVALLARQGIEAARRGGTLTAQLLAFSRSQALEQRPVEVRSLLLGIEDLLRRSLGPMMEVSLHLPESDIAAQADPTQLEMAVLNLAINARDAMPGGGRLTIRAAARRIVGDPELAPGDYATLKVSDDGPGMTAEVAARAFEPFFTTKGLGKGTGLGLSQVYGMARQAGGTVRIESHPGAGTTVRIWLPRAEGPSRPADRPPAPLGRTARSARVLVVDDDPDVRRWLVAALRSLGHETLAAADGTAGLLALEDEPEVVILDFAMPGMTGAETAAALRERRPGLPVILATGYADSEAIAATLPKGHPILRKPFGLEELDSALAEALGT